MAKCNLGKVTLFFVQGKYGSGKYVFTEFLSVGQHPLATACGVVSGLLW